MRLSSWPAKIILLAASMVACEATGPADPKLEFGRLSLAQKAIDVGVDEVQQLTVASSPDGGSVSWQSTNPNVATVSSTGLVSGRAIGTAKVVAASKRSTDTAVVSVHAPIGRLAIGPDSATIMTGQSIQLTLLAYDKSGKPISGISNSSGKWVSNDPTIVTVSDAGKVIAISRGVTTVTVTLNGKIARTFLRVSPVPVASVVVTPAPSAKVNVGSTLQMQAAAQDSTGKPISDWIVVWGSSDSSVAIVSSSGVLSARKVGSATITATAGDKKAQTTVLANPAVILSVAVAMNASTIQVGQTTQAAATAYDSSGNAITDRAVTWSSANPAVATVSPSGVVTGLSTGMAKITATVDGVTGAADENVGGATIANLSVVLGKSMMMAGDTTQAKAVATDAAGNPLTGRTVTWSSSNQSIATVSNLGVVTGLAVGTVSISAVVDGLTSSATEIVTAPVISSVVVTAPTTNLAIGQTTQAVAQALSSTGVAVTAPLTWSSSSPATATVSSSGLITAVAAGTATITATSGTISGTLGVAVTTQGPTVAPLTGVTAPELPRSYVKTDYPTFSGTVRNVPAGGDLQGALDAAQPGDQIVLAPGATYSGNYVIPNKAACATTSSYIVVRSGGLDSDYPAPGTRITPSYAPKLAKIVTPNVSPAIFVHGGACKWFVSRVEITATLQSSTVNYNYGLVRVGEGEGTVDWQPSDIVFDRVYVHGNPVSVQHAVILNGVRNAIVDSYVSDIHWVGVESHAVGSWAGAGPIKIVNNYLDAAGINVMFGGADPVISGLSPSDIEVRGNYLYKPLSYQGAGYAVKNLLELKNAKRVLIEGNVMENSWGDAQIGWAVIFQSSTDHPEVAPWTQTADVTMRYNVIKNVWGGADLTANGYNGSGIPATRIAIENNLFQNIGGGGTSVGVQLLNGLTDITVRHNTILRNTASYGMPFSLDGAGAARIAIADNLLGASTPYSSLFKTGGATGGAALTQFAGSAWTYVGNTAWSDVAPAAYPTGNNWASSQSAVGFASDWSLLSSSAYKGKASDGTDPGANMSMIQPVASRVPSGRGRVRIVP